MSIILHLINLPERCIEKMSMIIIRTHFEWMSPRTSSRDPGFLARNDRSKGDSLGFPFPFFFSRLPFYPFLQTRDPTVLALGLVSLLGGSSIIPLRRLD